MTSKYNKKSLSQEKVKVYVHQQNSTSQYMEID